MRKQILIVYSTIFLVLFNTTLISCKKKVAFSDNISTVSIAGNKAYVEVAVTEEEQRRGLMFRNKLDKDHGMLFIFQRERRASFWMKNTLIPLSIAFIKEDGWIAQIEDMQPKSLDHHVSEMRVKYVLEMNQGWFKEKEIGVGDILKIPPDIKAKDL